MLTAASGQTPSTYGEPGAEPARTVLVVDDEAAIVSLAGDMLRAGGYHVIQAVGSEQALRAIHGARIDLVLADAAMLGVDEIAHAVSRCAVNRNLPVIFMSGYTVAESCPANVLPKPFHMAELHRKVAEALSPGRW